MHANNIVSKFRLCIAISMTAVFAATLSAAQDDTAPSASQPVEPPSSPTLSDKAGQALDATKQTAREVWEAAKEKSKELYQSAREATLGGIAWLDDATYDARAECAAKLEKMADKTGEKIAEWKAGARELTPAAKERLDKAQADFRAAAKDLGNATAETWTSAKAKVSQSWNSLRKSIQNPDAACEGDASGCQSQSDASGASCGSQ